MMPVPYPMIDAYTQELSELRDRRRASEHERRRRRRSSERRVTDGVSSTPATPRTARMSAPGTSTLSGTSDR